MTSSKNDVSQFLAVGADQLETAPFPHLAGGPFLQPDLYARLLAEYPDDHYFELQQRRGARTGRDFYSSRPDFQAFLDSSPAWRSFYEFVNSAQFVDYTVGLFRGQLERFGCRVDPNKAHFESYDEPAGDMQWGKITHWSKSIRRRLGLLSTARANELFTRFDIEQGTSGYGKPVHCDIENRLASLVLFFCDADELAMDGGDLRVNEHREQKPLTRYERHPDEMDTRVVRELRPRHNLGVLFLCSNNSYHSVTPIRSSKGYRKFIYLNVSSRADTIW